MEVVLRFIVLISGLFQSSLCSDIPMTIRAECIDSLSVSFLFSICHLQCTPWDLIRIDCSFSNRLEYGGLDNGGSTVKVLMVEFAVQVVLSRENLEKLILVSLVEDFNWWLSVNNFLKYYSIIWHIQIAAELDLRLIILFSKWVFHHFHSMYD